MKSGFKIREASDDKSQLDSKCSVRNNLQKGRQRNKLQQYVPVPLDFMQVECRQRLVHEAHVQYEPRLRHSSALCSMLHISAVLAVSKTKPSLLASRFWIR